VNKSCEYCDESLEHYPVKCPSCNKNIGLANGAAQNKSLDEIKKNLLAMFSKAVSIAKIVGNELANEIKKINEARKQTVESTEFKGTESKKVAFKNGIQMFWKKLTAKQKVITLGVPIIFFIILISAFKNTDSDIVGCARPSKSEQYERCTELLINGSQQLVGSKLFGSEVWGLKYRRDSGFDVVELQFSSSTSRKQALATMNKLCKNNLKVITDDANSFTAMTKPTKAGEPNCSINMVVWSPKMERYATNNTQWGVFNASTINWR
jgi:hypothetical protein